MVRQVELNTREVLNSALLVTGVPKWLWALGQAVLSKQSSLIKLKVTSVDLISLIGITVIVCVCVLIMSLLKG